ncbi:MAG TPA: acyltransferase [Mycobacteriales bacterium]|nr:acyltransferase [Mycobacteriales bacterium]
MRYRPALDGVRGLCMVGVLLGHLVIFGGVGLTFNTHVAAPFEGMELGLTVFFVLSGALITHLLLNEMERTGRVDMRAFRIRRVRRLAPAAVMILIATATLWLTGVRDLVTPLGPHPWLVIGSVVFLSSNWLLFSQTYSLGYLTPTWSLTVEEQFYVGWPLLLSRCWRRVGAGGAALFAVSLLLCGQALSILLSGRDEYATYATPVSGVGLLVGCLLAIGLHSGIKPRLVAVLRHPAPAALAAVGMGFGARWLHFHEQVGLHGGYFVFDVVTAIVIGHLLVVEPRQGVVARVLGFGPFAYLGRISYGAYLFHATIYQMWDRSLLLPNLWVRGTVDVCSTLIAASITYVLIEEPIRRGRMSWRAPRVTGARTADRPVPAAPPAAPIGRPVFLPPAPVVAQSPVRPVVAPAWPAVIDLRDTVPAPAGVVAPVVPPPRLGDEPSGWSTPNLVPAAAATDTSREIART